MISQYLSPEPLLQSPSYVSAMAQNGMSVPTYAYAANNPLRYSDQDGLYVRTNFQSSTVNGGDVCRASGHTADSCFGYSSRSLTTKCSPRPCGGYGFDATVNFVAITNFHTEGPGDPTPWGPGATVGEHEAAHVGDFAEGAAEASVNQSIATEGFSSIKECERARRAFDARLGAYIQFVGRGSERRRDPILYAR